MLKYYFRVTAISEKSNNNTRIRTTSSNFTNKKSRKIIHWLNPFSMTSKFTSEKNDITYRNTKFCNGKVRQHRDRFEKAVTRNTFPPSNSVSFLMKNFDKTNYLDSFYSNNNSRKIVMKKAKVFGH